MKKILLTSFVFLWCLTTFAQSVSLSSLVDPFIGTGGHGHTFPGATVPFGMVQLSPDTRIDGSWDGCSGYHYSDSIIYGFSHTHLSGTGCSDYGDVMLMPTEGELSYDKDRYSSRFSHSSESAAAGYYSVQLLDDKIQVELTATTRVGLHRYTFQNKGKAHVILDLNHRDKLLEGKVEVLDSKTILVFRRSEAWARDQYVFARIEFSKPFNAHSDRHQQQYNFDFDVKSGEQILVKVALSPVSTDGASLNMSQELTGWDFETIKKNAQEIWEKELSKIEVKSSNNADLKIFYTALYHTMIQPNVAMDVNGNYRGRDNKIHQAKGFTYYSVFSLWDTFRAAHPLYTIIDRKRSLDFIKTFLAQYQDGGRLPVWELSCNETDCMIGYHSVSVIADAAIKGINDFDQDLALQAMVRSATGTSFGIPAYNDHGYLAVEDEHESVSKTLEYAYDDWCIAQMAKLTSKTDVYAEYIKRSQYWKNVFDPQTDFMRPRKNGGWISPFEPREVNNNFTEGNSWQYSFFVPQDITGLIRKMGGPEAFEKKLDELFSANSSTTGRDQADITGLIGQYAHGNEPSHHMAYLYTYVNRAYKTQEKVHRILTQFYTARPDGLIGNEDCGQMSAWYVLSSMGFYQVCPAKDQFAVGYPLFDQVTIHLENGKQFHIQRSGWKPGNDYLAGVEKDGKILKNFFTYKDIMNGAGLNFTMTATPVIDPISTVLSESSEGSIVENPVITAPSRVFKEKIEVQLQDVDKNATIYYTLDNSEPTSTSAKYILPIVLTDGATVKAIAVNQQGEKSFCTTGVFYKMPNNWSVSISSVPNPQYTAGGPDGIIDGIHGDKNWRKGDWQGYQSQDFVCVIDLGKETTISEIDAGFLQDTRSWIIFPTEVSASVSSDGKIYQYFQKQVNTVPAKDEQVQVQNMVLKATSPVKARYIQLTALNFGKLPEWHQGAGGDAFIFVDEIGVK